MVVVSTFLLNFLCAISSCDPTMKPPEILKPANAYKRKIAQEEPLVKTESGLIEGYTMYSTEGKRIFAFEGIPYSMPAMGKLRFKAPVPVKSWDGILMAKKQGPECLQLSPPKILRVVGNENCLFLNIYVHAQEDYYRFKNLPVLFYIHGGSYYFGSAQEIGPSYLLNKELILVTVNYRLGVLGFLSTGEESCPGNNGLKDQALALKWIYENIEYFGGDKNRITISGQSSGASSSHLHLLSHKSRKYISSGLSFSGNAFTNFAIKKKSELRRLTERIAKLVNCRTKRRSSREIVDCLRSVNPVSLVGRQLQLLEWAPFPITLFSPVIEPESEEAFLIESPQKTYNRREISLSKPWVFSMTSDEGYLGLLFLRSFFSEYSLRNRWSELAPIFLDYKYTAGNQVSEITEKLTNFYFGNESPKRVDERKIIELFGDRYFLHGLNRAIKEHSKIADTYSYIFDYKGKYNAANVVGIDSNDWGVGHTEDIWYMFNSSFYYSGFQRSDEEYKMSQFMTTILSNFITNGEPISTDLKIWEKVDPNNIMYLNISHRVSMINQPFQSRLEFWENLTNEDKLRLNMQ